VPTLREEGIDLVTDGRYGLAAPPGLDRGVARVLHEAFQEALLDPAHLAVLNASAWPRSKDRRLAPTTLGNRRDADRALLERLGLRLS
jgi:tripartite-type tricarboxylate transporter receptor subunit TctC